MNFTEAFQEMQKGTVMRAKNKDQRIFITTSATNEPLIIVVGRDSKGNFTRGALLVDQRMIFSEGWVIHENQSKEGEIINGESFMHAYHKSRNKNK